MPQEAVKAVETKASLSRRVVERRGSMSAFWNDAVGRTTLEIWKRMQAIDHIRYASCATPMFLETSANIPSILVSASLRPAKFLPFLLKSNALLRNGVWMTLGHHCESIKQERSVGFRYPLLRCCNLINVSVTSRSKWSINKAMVRKILLSL